MKMTMTWAGCSAKQRTNWGGVLFCCNEVMVYLSHVWQVKTLLDDIKRKYSQGGNYAKYGSWGESFSLKLVHQTNVS